MSKEENPQTPQVYKRDQFDQFLKALETGAHGHWIEVAQSIGVDRDTIQAWRSHPEAIKIRQEGIAHAMKEMERAGSRDWRMWEAKLKLLGMQAAEKIEHSGEIKAEHVILYKPEHKPEGSK